MARMCRKVQFSPDKFAIMHVVNRADRRCILMGEDPFTGRNFDYRKKWIERRKRPVLLQNLVEL
ncbi:MAG: hypothetical protein KF752_00755 [Pirellulaceae bacterium]|nr:hypothetical protein [Pirellulaceae bacterium]